MTIKPEQLTEAVQDLLGEEVAAVAEATSEVIPDLSKEAAKMVRKNAPRRSGKGGGEYARTWTSKVEKGRMQTTATVYAKAPGYKLAHLLEFGHANRDGGRTAAIVHIKPVEDWVIEEAEKRIAKAIEEAQG